MIDRLIQLSPVSAEAPLVPVGSVRAKTTPATKTTTTTKGAVKTAA